AQELGISIQHLHLNEAEKCWEGDEHRPAAWRKKPIDGFYHDAATNTNVAIEYLGDYYHGHPDLWGDDTCSKDHFGRMFSDVFCDTQRKLAKLKSLGYKVLYVWDADVKQRKALQSLLSICRTFEEELEW